jgi:hypothetical protein
MKPHFTGVAVAALLVVGFTLPSLADDAAPAAAPPPAVQTEAPPPSVPRPSIVPNTAEPAPAPAAAEPAPSPRRTAHRHRRGYGSYRAAYWEPFPIYWPHLARNHIHWNRVPWILHF